MMLDLIRGQRQLLTNASSRRRGNRIWLVPIDDALLNTDLENEIVPLPVLDDGLVLVRKPPTIGFEIIKRIRLLIGDDANPFYFSNTDLSEFYAEEGNDLEQAAALACEVWASRLSYNEGNYSSGGLTINSSSTAADKRQLAAELRMRFVKTATPRR